MTIRRKTRKRGGGAREKLVAWINYVLEYAHGHGWEKFPMIESQTNKNGKIVKTVVEVEASETFVFGLSSTAYRFPSTKKSMDKKYATGLAMHLWNPQRGTGTNHDLYRRFESQYHNDSNIESLYGNESASRSHSPDRGRNIKKLGQQFGQQLNEVQEQLASMASSSAASASSSTQPIQYPQQTSVSTKSNQTNVRGKPKSVSTSSVQTNVIEKPRAVSNMSVQTNNVREKPANESNIEWNKMINGIDEIAAIIGDKAKYVYDKVQGYMQTYLDEIQYENIVTVYSEWFLSSCINNDYTGGGDIYIITKTGVHHSVVNFHMMGVSMDCKCSFYKMYVFNNLLSHQLCKLFIKYASMHLPLITSPCRGYQQKKEAYDIHTDKFMAIVTAIPGIKFSPLESGWMQVGPELYFNVNTNKKTKIPPYQSPPITYS